jgi:hypothetical protein
MSEAQHIRAKVYVPGRPKQPRLQRPLTLDTICEWIKLQGLDDYTTNGLIELARRYPTQALPTFRKNFNIMIQRVRQKRRQEQNQPLDERIEEIENGQGENEQVAEG